jgi:diguanylate cyclase (GGDEF)-like protein
MMAARRAVPDAAIVVVVPWFEEALFLSAIRLGAEDCVTAAQLDSPGLLRVLLVAAERHRLTSSLRAAAFTDELTGLYNRRGYVTRAATLLKVAEPKTIWQIFFDVDELKIINDTYGHWAGDRALMEVAAVLRQAFRSTDIVARVGGDEFAVLATAPADAAPDSWTARWREPFVALATRKDLPLSVSVGLAQPDEHGQMTPEDLLTRADTTMYTAKRLRKKLIDGRGLRPPGPLAVGATR